MVYFSALLTISMLIYAAVGSFLADSDRPTYFSILLFGVGVLDLTSDYQLTLQLYVVGDQKWIFCFCVCVLTSLGGLAYFVRWYILHVNKTTVVFLYFFRIFNSQ